MRIANRTAAVAGAAVIGLAALGGVAVATDVGPFGGDLDRPGSIAVDERALPDDDTAERAALAAFDTVEESAARAAAVASAGGGEAVDAELTTEDGFVIWDVLVRAADGTWREVKVDAGDASILASERDQDD
jgi:hypothetical protein